jgi:acyl-coenzyme A synthetase/AMP-(fatty) acid ligase
MRHLPFFLFCGCAWLPALVSCPDASRIVAGNGSAGAQPEKTVLLCEERCRDSDGYFWFKGRKKEIIVRGGSNISPQEVEEALHLHPAVAEAGVIGMPDPLYGERVIAFLSRRPDAHASEEELLEHARQRLADHKVPERIIFMSELPKGPTGKVHRRGLREMALADLGVLEKRSEQSA